MDEEINQNVTVLDSDVVNGLNQTDIAGYNVLRLKQKVDKNTGKIQVGNQMVNANGNLIIKKEKIRKFMKDKQRQINELKENRK